MTPGPAFRSRRLKIQASLRDTLLLLREFRGPLLVFLTAVFGGGTAYYLIALGVGEPVTNLAESFYIVLSLAFFQPSREFPRHPLLEVFYFLMPVIGIGILAFGLADFGYLLFNRKARSKEWQMAIASTLTKHHVLVGLGHLGFNILQTLKDMNQQAVVIEQNPSADLVTAVQALDIPLILEDASREPALVSAGIRKAASIILCIQNDALNLKIALKARALNPKIRVVIRIFDDDFAAVMGGQFQFTPISSTGIAAPVFAASATASDITRPINIEDENFSLARIQVAPNSKLHGLTVGHVEDGYNVTIVFIKHNAETTRHPPDAHPIQENAILAVLGGPQRLHRLIHDSQ